MPQKIKLKPGLKARRPAGKYVTVRVGCSSFRASSDRDYIILNEKDVPIAVISEEMFKLVFDWEYE